MNQRKVGVILSYLSQAIHILSGLIYTPIMLRLLGQSEYGLYQLVSSVVSYLSLLSFGFSASYMRFYSRYKAKDEKESIAKLNGMFLTIFLVIATVCLFCGVVMVANIRGIFGTGLTEPELETAKILMMLMVVNLALTFPNSVFDSFTSAAEKFFFQKLLIVVQNILNPFLCLPLLIMGYGSVGMVLVTTFLTISVLLTNIWYCTKNIKVKFCFTGFDLKLLKEMWIFTVFIFINQIIDQVNWSVGKLLLGRLAGTTAVAIYGLGAQINSMYLQFSTAVCNVFVPKVNRIIAGAEGNGKRIDNELTLLFTKLGRIQFLILSLILTGFIFFGKPFMYFWGGKGYEDSYYVTLLLIIPVTVPLIQNLGVEIQRAKNKHKARSFVYLGIAVVNICASIPLIMHWGVLGAAAGTAASLTLGNVLFMNWYYHRYIGLDIRFFWRSIASILPGMLIPCVIGIWIMNCVNIDRLWKLVAGIICYTLIYCTCVWLFGMNKEEKNMIQRPLHRILKK